jgi:hypothetical protein
MGQSVVNARPLKIEHGSLYRRNILVIICDFGSVFLGCLKVDAVCATCHITNAITINSEVVRMKWEGLNSLEVCHRHRAT